MAVRAAELEVVVTADASQATDEINSTNDALGRIGQFAVGEKLTQWGSDALGFAKNFILAGASFAQEMAFVDKLSGGGAQDFQNLQDKALSMGEKTIFSAQEAAQGMEQLAREGFTPTQIIGTDTYHSLIDGAANMAAALSISLPDAANMIGMTMRSYSDTTLKASEATDILTQAALRSGKSASEFNSQLSPVLSTADQLHIPLEQAAAAVSMLMSENVPNAGGSLRAFLVGVTTDGTVAYKAISQLGINARDALSKGGLPELIDEINKAMQGMSPDEQSKFIKDMSGGNKQVSGLIQALRDGEPGFASFIQKMHSLGSAASVMSALINTTAGSFHILQSSIFTAEKVMGDAVDGYLKPLVDAAAAVVNAFIAAPPVVHLVAAALVILGGIALTLAGGLLIALAIGIGNVVAAAALGIAAVTGIAVVFGLLAAAIVLAKPKIDEFLSAFDVGKQAGFNTFQAALFALAETFPSLAPFFDNLRAKVTQLGNSFNDLRHLGVDPFDAAMIALEDTFPRLIPMLNDFKAAGDRLIAAYGAGGLRGVLIALPGAIKLVADGLLQAGILLAPVAVRVAKWAVSEIASGVESLAGSVAKFVSDHWKSIKDAGYDAVGYAIRLGKWALRTVDNLFDAIQKWVSSAWSTIKDVGYDAAGYAIRLGKWAIKETDKLSDAITKWVKDNVTAANLADIGTTVGDRVAAAINSINWANVGQTFGYALGTALGAGAKLAIAILGAAATLAINLLKDGQLYNSILSMAGHLVEGFAKGFGDAMQQQFPGLVSKIRGFVKDVTDAWNDLPGPIRKVVSDIGSIMGDLGKYVIAAGLAGIALHFAFGAIGGAIAAVGVPLVAFGGAAIAAAPEIALLAGAAVLAYEGFKHWNTIAGYVERFGNVAGPAAGAIDALGIALGVLDPPLGILILAALGIGEVVAHFDSLKRAVSDLGGAIKGAWDWINNLAKLAWGPISGAEAFVGSLGAVKGALDGLTAAYNAAQTALHWISSHIGSDNVGPGGTTNAGQTTGPPNSQVGALKPIYIPAKGTDLDPVAINRGAQSVLGAIPNPWAGPLGPTASPPSVGFDVDPRAKNPQLGGRTQTGALVTSLPNVGSGSSLFPPGMDPAAMAAAGRAAGQAFATALGQGLQTALTAMTAVASALGAVAQAATGRLVSAGTASGQGWARALGAGLQTGLTAVAAVMSAINTIVSALTGKLTADGTTAGTGWARSLGTGLQLGLTAVTAVTTAITTIMSAWGTRTVQIGQQTGQQMAVAWGQGLQLALTATTAVMTAMNTIITTAFTQMKTTAQSNANGMAAAVGSAFHSMQNAATNDANAMRTSVTNAFNTMKSNGQAAVNGLASAVGSAFNSMRNQAVSAAQSMMSQVTGAINAGAGSAAGAAYNAGASIGAGLANGMYSELGAVQAAAAALANAAAAAANVALNARSPSLVFVRIGRFVGEGFVLGIRASLADAARAVRDGVVPAITAAEGAVSQALARPGATVAAGRGGTTVVYVTNNNTVRVDDLPDVIRAAQFVRDSDSVRQLIMGTT